MTVTISHRVVVNGYPGEATLHTVRLPDGWGVPAREARLDLATADGVRIAGRVVDHLYSDTGVMLFVETFR